MLSRALDPAALPRGVNHVRLWWVHPPRSDATGDADGACAASAGAHVLNIDVPPDAFDAALARAARHPGYVPRRLNHVVEHVGTLERVDDGGGRVSVCSRRCLGATALPGAPIVALHYEETRLPMAAFPCDARPHDARRVEALALRVHQHARLVFEAHHGEDHPDGAVTRTVRVDVDLRDIAFPGRRGGGGAAAHNTLSDLTRTVENTVHVVLMGAPPLRRAAGATSSAAR